MANSTHIDPDEQPEPTQCPDCGAGLSRSETEDAVILDCPSCEAQLVYPK